MVMNAIQTTLSCFSRALIAGWILIAMIQRADACCVVAARGNHVVNADQTVIMIWDEERQTQHFIRKADFKTDAVDVGFLVPSPSRPQLAESGNAAFAKLDDITPYRDGLLESLGLPDGAGPAKWRLTLFEDRWPYAKAAGDVYFVRDRDQRSFFRQAAVTGKPGDAVFVAMLAAACVLPFKRRKTKSV
jgi:hypothetical protein